MRTFHAAALASIALLCACSKDKAPAPVATASASQPAGLAEMPEWMRGRWGLVLADCTSTKGDAKGLLTIGATTLTYYESRGTLRAPGEGDAAQIRATFDFTGEGSTWTREMSFEIQSGGTVLLSNEYGDGAAPKPLIYSRCR